MSIECLNTECRFNSFKEDGQKNCFAAVIVNTEKEYLMKPEGTPGIWGLNDKLTPYDEKRTKKANFLIRMRLTQMLTCGNNKALKNAIKIFERDTKYV